MAEIVRTRMDLASVVMPVYDRLPFVQASVASVLSQTYENWELLIADDGSAEATRAYLRSLSDPRIRVLRLPHSENPAIARNAALGEARGRYVAFLDSDDLWEPAKLSRQLTVLAAHPECRWSYTGLRLIDSDGAPVKSARWPSYDGDVVEPLLRIAINIATPTVMAERRLVEDAGGFDEQQKFIEDYDLWLRLALRSKVAFVDEELASVRLHADSYASNREGCYAGWDRLYVKAAAMLREPRLQRLCRRRRAIVALGLAGVHGHRRDMVAVLNTLARSAPYSWDSPAWWWGAIRAATRPVAPAVLRRWYRKLRRDRAAVP